MPWPHPQATWGDHLTASLTLDPCLPWRTRLWSFQTPPVLGRAFRYRNQRPKLGNLPLHRPMLLVKAKERAVGARKMIILTGRKNPALKRDALISTPKGLGKLVSLESGLSPFVRQGCTRRTTRALRATPRMCPFILTRRVSLQTLRTTSPAMAAPKTTIDAAIQLEMHLRRQDHQVVGGPEDYQSPVQQAPRMVENPGKKTTKGLGNQAARIRSHHPNQTPPGMPAHTKHLSQGGHVCGGAVVTQWGALTGSCVSGTNLLSVLYKTLTSDD